MIDQPIDKPDQAGLIEVACAIGEAFLCTALIREPVPNSVGLNIGRLLALGAVQDGFHAANGLVGVLLAITFGQKMLLETLRELVQALSVHGCWFLDSNRDTLLTTDLLSQHRLCGGFIIAEGNSANDAVCVTKLAVPLLADLRDALAGGGIFGGVFRLEETRHGVTRWNVWLVVEEIQ